MRRTRRPWTLTLLAGLITAAFLLPVYWMAATSLKQPAKILAVPPQWVPVPVTGENYTVAFDFGLPRALVNSVVISCGVVALTLLLAVPLSYAVSRSRMRGSGVMLLALLVAQLLPSIVLAAPLFIIEHHAGLTDTYTGLILADTTVTLPFAVIVLRPLLRTVPTELEDAAQADGCGVFGVLLHVVLPAMVPGLVAVVALSFVLGWGEFVFGLTLVQSTDVQPVTVLLNSFVGHNATEWGPLMATSTLISLPVVLVFAFFRRFAADSLGTGRRRRRA